MTTSAAITSATVPTGSWAIVPRNSTAAFAVRNFGVKTVRGIVPIRDATVVVTGDRQVAEVHATLDLAAIDTANGRRDKDLRKRHLLDTQQYPDLVFDCADVRESAGGWALAGTLTARGATTPVQLTAEVAGGPANGLLAVRACTSLDRRELQITAPRFMIGHQVLVEITAQFRLS